MEGAGILRRADGWPDDPFAVITRGWAGLTVLCIGGGPSATPERVARCAGRWKTITVNNSFLLAPWADLMYFADVKWWRWYASQGTASMGFSEEEVKRRYATFAGQKCTIENTGKSIEEEGVFMLRNLGSEQLSESSNGVHTGANGGYQVVNIAWLAGARRIVLLGYDASFPGGRSHNHDGHPVKSSEATYRRWGSRYRTMLPQLERTGTEVVNCSDGRGIDAFPFADIESVLADS